MCDVSTGQLIMSEIAQELSADDTNKPALLMFVCLVVMYAAAASLARVALLKWCEPVGEGGRADGHQHAVGQHSPQRAACDTLYSPHGDDEINNGRRRWLA